MDSEEQKLFGMNRLLQHIKSKAKRIPKLNDDRYYHFTITVEELVNDPNIPVRYKNTVTSPPQLVFLSNLYINANKRNQSVLQNYHILTDSIAPSYNRCHWLSKKDLIVSREMKLYIKLNTLEMTRILKYCPNPTVCLDPEKFVIEHDPYKFMETINSLRKVNDIYNYVFNFLQYYPRHIIRENAIYRQKKTKEMELVNSKCFTKEDGDGESGKVLSSNDMEVNYNLPGETLSSDMKVTPGSSEEMNRV